MQCKATSSCLAHCQWFTTRGLFTVTVHCPLSITRRKGAILPEGLLHCMLSAGRCGIVLGISPLVRGEFSLSSSEAFWTGLGWAVAEALTRPDNDVCF